MENLKTAILEVLNRNSNTIYGKGSCGELGDSSLGIDSYLFSEVAEEITNIINSCTDPENQPNQYGVELLKDEQNRIWNQLLKILPYDDKGNTEKGDEVYQIVFNKPLSKELGDIFKKSFEESVEVVIKYISEHHHPHTMIQIDSTQAILWEGVKNHLTEKFLKD